MAFDENSIDAVAHDVRPGQMRTRTRATRMIANLRKRFRSFPHPLDCNQFVRTWPSRCVLTSLPHQAAIETASQAGRQVGRVEQELEWQSTEGTFLQNSESILCLRACHALLLLLCRTGEFCRLFPKCFALRLSCLVCTNVVLRMRSIRSRVLNIVLLLVTHGGN